MRSGRSRRRVGYCQMACCPTKPPPWCGCSIPSDGRRPRRGPRSSLPAFSPTCLPKTAGMRLRITCSGSSRSASLARWVMSLMTLCTFVCSLQSYTWKQCVRFFHCNVIFQGFLKWEIRVEDVVLFCSVLILFTHVVLDGRKCISLLSLLKSSCMVLLIISSCYLLVILHPENNSLELHFIMLIIICEKWFSA